RNEFAAGDAAAPVEVVRLPWWPPVRLGGFSPDQRSELNVVAWELHAAEPDLGEEEFDDQVRAEMQRRYPGLEQLRGGRLPRDLVRQWRGELLTGTDVEAGVLDRAWETIRVLSAALAELRGAHLGRVGVPGP